MTGEAFSSLPWTAGKPSGRGQRGQAAGGEWTVGMRIGDRLQVYLLQLPVSHLGLCLVRDDSVHLETPTHEHEVGDQTTAPGTCPRGARERADAETGRRTKDVSSGGLGDRE